MKDHVVEVPTTTSSGDFNFETPRLTLQWDHLALHVPVKNVGVAFMISCLCPNIHRAPVTGYLVFLPFLLSGGLYLNSDDVPAYFVWIQYLSPIRYGFEALMKLFWREMDAIPCQVVEHCVATTGHQVLEVYRMTTTSAPVDVAAFVALNVGFRVVVYAGLLSDPVGAGQAHTPCDLIFGRCGMLCTVYECVQSRDHGHSAVQPPASRMNGSASQSIPIH